jgi:hypothetical protein
MAASTSRAATANRRATVVGSFRDSIEARAAISALMAAGFTESQIGVTALNSSGEVSGDLAEDDSYAAEGAATGVAAGAGAGALWGIAIVSGLLPAIGPAIAGGTLAAVLSSAAAGAAAMGVAGTLVGLGIPKEEAEYYEAELRSGRTIVTVNATSRAEEAREILQRYGGYRMGGY